MPHGRLEKVEIKDKDDELSKIKREFFLPKRLYNEIVEICWEEGCSFSFWVMDACRKKIIRENNKKY